MSALARYYKRQGADVHGYDRTETPLTQALVSEGMHVHYEDDITRIPEGVELVVYTPAVPKDHCELNYFLDNGYPVKKRAEVLGLISKAKRCVAVAGTHGKTTTSSMVTWLMHCGKTDITAFLGGIATNFANNYIEGGSDWVVVEADEYDRSFLHLHPEIAILNSLDPDHLDIYGTPEAMVETYKQFVRQIKPGGTLLYKHGLPVADVAAELKADGRRVYSFGIDAGDFRAERLHVADGALVFDWVTPVFGTFVAVKMFYPGRHNVENAVAALAAACLATQQPQQVTAGLAEFKGVQRRFEYHVQQSDLVYIDDYAHHPTELEAAIGAARMFYPGWRIVGVFQPHLYTRTRDFADGFAKALDELDACILLPIYPARELPIEGVRSEMLLEKMKLKDKILVEKNELLTTLHEKINAQKGTGIVVLTLGAGDIDAFVGEVKRLIG